MKVIDYKEVPARPVEVEGVKGVKIRWLISQKEAPNFAMRMFELEPESTTPRHTHDYEHEVFILEGTGELIFEEEVKPFKAGYVVYVPPDKLHRFRNTGKDTLKFLCLVPNKKK
ncbi:MAG: cupin domain-containing protein [Planctomycetes bacterium]|nr:cupin domain-containing protein [Planctomycetota bacterium]